MKQYEIVDRVQTFKDYIDGKIEESEISVVNLEVGEVMGMPELMAADVLNDNLVFLKLTTN